MKIWFYGNNDELTYQDGMADWICENLENRTEILNKKEKSQEIEVREFAKGSTCVVYLIESGNHKGGILKVFCPEELVKLKQIKQNEDGSVSFLTGGKTAVKTEYKKFLESCRFPSALEEYCISKGINLYIKPKIVLTSMGYVLLCEKTGDPLKVSFERILEKLCGGELTHLEVLKRTLEKIFRILNMIKIACDGGVLMLDIKPENMSSVTGDIESEELLVRQFDYGSCILNRELIDKISEYRECGFQDWMVSKYFSSNRKYYSEKDIEKTVKNILNGDLTEDGAEKELHFLDLLAVKKILCDILLCIDKSYLSLDDNKEIETDNLKNILKSFFINKGSKISYNLMETYNIYRLLMEFLEADNVYYMMECTLNVLSILEKNVFWKHSLGEINMIEKQRNSLYFNEIYVSKRNLLDKTEITSFKKLLQKVNEVFNSESVPSKDLFWYLVLGYKHS